MNGLIKRFEVLAHPGFELAQSPSLLRVDERGLRNIQLVRDAWLESIVAIANDNSSVLILVNSVELGLENGPTDQFLDRFIYNPFRGLYQEILDASLSIGQRRMVCSPSIFEKGFRIDSFEDSVRVQVGSATFFYARDAVMVGYGEHSDGAGVGCVDKELRTAQKILNLDGRVDNSRTLYKGVLEVPFYSTISQVIN